MCLPDIISPSRVYAQQFIGLHVQFLNTSVRVGPREPPVLATIGDESMFLTKPLLSGGALQLSRLLPKCHWEYKFVPHAIFRRMTIGLHVRYSQGRVVKVLKRNASESEVVGVRCTLIVACILRIHSAYIYIYYVNT